MMSAVSRVNEIYAKAHTYKHVLFTNICISGPNSVTNILITRRGGGFENRKHHKCAGKQENDCDDHDYTHSH